MPSSHGRQAFLDYYTSRIPLESLTTDYPPILRFDPKYEEELRKLWEQAHLPWKTIAWYPYALVWPKTDLEILPGYQENLIYPMSASSLLPVLALNPQADDIVLDACAAPGGKALMIAERLNHPNQLMANDISAARRQRMKQLFSDWHYSDIQITSRPAETLFKTYPNYFDKILVDAPCSSEKHVYNSPKHLQQWSYNRIKQLKQRQLAMLSGLFLSLKPGGTMVYSTCAITPEENEQVVEKLLKKKGTAIELLSWPLPAVPGEGETTRRIWPHTHQLDPMFVAVLRRLS